MGDDENIDVSNSVPVILDLNGYTLTSNNYTPIQVQPDVICTIKNGTVTNTAEMKAAVFNCGTLTVQNCTLNANNYFSLYNCCTATVTDSTLNGNYNGNSIINDQANSDTVTLTLSGTVNMEGSIYNAYAASVVTVLPAHITLTQPLMWTPTPTPSPTTATAHGRSPQNKPFS